MTWTHAICPACWDERAPGRTPVQVRDAEQENCCFCGRITAAGIYVRHDPRALSCEHPEEER